jgi:hypothetical protein
MAGMVPVTTAKVAMSGMLIAVIAVLVVVVVVVVVVVEKEAVVIPKVTVVEEVAMSVMPGVGTAAVAVIGA